MVKPTPSLTNRFLVLEMSTVGSTRDMLTPQSPVAEPNTEKAMPQEPSQLSSDLTPVLIHSLMLCRETELPLCAHTIGSNTLMLREKKSLINLGVTGHFINIDYISKKPMYQVLPQSHPYL